MAGPAARHARWLAGVAAGLLAPGCGGDDSDASPGAGGSGTGGAGGSAAGGASLASGHRVALTSYGGCIVDSRSNLVCWGGYKATPNPGSGRVDILSGSDAGEYICSLDAAGAGRCWPRPSRGSAFDLRGSALTRIATGSDFACGLRSADRAILCFGMPGEMPPASVLAPPAGEFVDLCAAASRACAVSVDGSLACWGEALTEFQPPAGVFKTVRCGSTLMCATRNDGALTCWGAETAGQVMTPLPGAFTDVALAQSGSLPNQAYGCGIRDDGSLASWGKAPPGAPATGSYREIHVAGPTEYSDGSGCAVQRDGVLSCFGEYRDLSRKPPTGLVVK